MKLHIIKINPIDENSNGFYSVEKANELLVGANHVETYTKDDGCYGGQRTLIIFAFYPDEISHSILNNVAIKDFEQILNQGTVGYSFRDIIDNLTDEQIIDAVEEYAIQFRTH